MKMASFFKTREQRILERNYTRLAQVNALIETYRQMSQADMLALIEKYIKQLNHRTRSEVAASDPELYSHILVNMHAMVREASRRTVNQFHYDQQILGSLAMTDNCIIEMKTGEGKTLTCIPSACFRAIFKKGVHIATANDYLAQRDCDWMSPIYNYLNLTVGCVVNSTAMEDKKKQFGKDVTYLTNNEVGFSFLRDHLKLNPTEISMRGLFEIIADEADHHLLDCARVPYIISSATANEDEADTWKAMKVLVDKLDPSHYEMEQQNKTVYLNTAGYKFVEQELGKLKVKDVFSSEKSASYLFFIDKLLKAKLVMSKDKDYVVKEDKVCVVDEFTGRTYENRKFSEGMHQAIEAKEGVPITFESHASASITIQGLIRKYRQISGMTGTAFTDRHEFFSVYGIDVVRIPTIEPKKVTKHKPLFFATKKNKFEAILKVIETNTKGQPILVGTTSIRDSEYLSEMLTKKGLRHNVLNAVKHEHEAKIISEAGALNSITLSTNMSGRGTHVYLGGDREFIIAQKNIVEPAQIEKITAECAAQREKVLAAGGLKVIIAGLSETRRTASQLEGRTARRGEQGEIMYFFSAEDDTVKQFGLTDNLKLMSMLDDGSGFHSSTIEKLFQKIQLRAEDMAQDARRRLMNLDLIIDSKRDGFNRKRMEILLADESQMAKIIEEASEDFKQMYKNGIDTQSVRMFNTIFKSVGIKIDFSHNLQVEVLIEKLDELRSKLTAGKFIASRFQQIKKFILDCVDFLWKEFLLSIECAKNMASFKTLKNRNIVIGFSLETDAFYVQLMKGVVVSIACAFLSALDSFESIQKTQTIEAHEDKILRSNLSREELISLIELIK